jgi:AraC-like DNA-binding protein
MMRQELDPSTSVRTSDFTGFLGLRVIIREKPKVESYSSGNRGTSYFLIGYRPGPERGSTIVRFRGKKLAETRMTRVSAVIPPEQPFDVNYSDAEGRIATFEIEPRFLTEVVRRAGISSIKLMQLPPPRFLINQRVDYLCSLLMRETERRESMAPFYFESLAAALVVAVLSQTDARHPNPRNLYVQNERIQKAIAFIEANFPSKLTRAQIAAAAHLSENHLSGLFHSIVGLTAQEYILQCRLRFAENLLLLHGQPCSISEVAAEAGFSDQAHFSRHFRRYFGRTPQDYRHQYI